MDADANLYQDVTEIAGVDAHMDADIIPDLSSAEITAVYGLSFFLFSVEDAAVIHLAAMAAVVTTTVSGSFSFLFSVEDAVTTPVVTMAADVTIVAANYNKRNSEDGFVPSFLHAFIPLMFTVINLPTHSYKFTTIQKECIWNENLRNS